MDSVMQRVNSEESSTAIERRGEVPFLNGGLFEMHGEYDQRNAVHIPNDAFAEILNSLSGTTSR